MNLPDSQPRLIVLYYRFLCSSIFTCTWRLLYQVLQIDSCVLWYFASRQSHAWQHWVCIVTLWVAEVAVYFQVESPGIQCPICHMTFNNESAISAHYDTAHAQTNIRPEHPDARHKCEFCSRKFTRKSSLNLHRRTIHGVGDVKTFQCNFCTKVCKEKGNLKKHLTSVHGVGDVKRFACNVCSKVFKENSDLLKHLANVHSIGDIKYYPCDACSQNFKSIQRGSAVSHVGCSRLGWCQPFDVWCLGHCLYVRCRWFEETLKDARTKYGRIVNIFLYFFIFKK